MWVIGNVTLQHRMLPCARGDAGGDADAEDWPMNQSVDLSIALPTSTAATLGASHREER